MKPETFLGLLTGSAAFVAAVLGTTSYPFGLALGYCLLAFGSGFLLGLLVAHVIVRVRAAGEEQARRAYLEAADAFDSNHPAWSVVDDPNEAFWREVRRWTAN